MTTLRFIGASDTDKFIPERVFSNNENITLIPDLTDGNTQTNVKVYVTFNKVSSQATRVSVVIGCKVYTTTNERVINIAKLN